MNESKFEPNILDFLLHDSSSPNGNHHSISISTMISRDASFCIIANGRADPS